MAIKNIQDAEVFAGLIQKIASDMGSIKKENLLETVPQLFQIIKTAVLDDPIDTKSIVMEPSIGYEMIGDPIGFTKTDHGSEVDIIIPGILEITRGESGGIYNSAQEESFDNGSSPLGTEWNSIFTDSVNYGFDDLSNVSERIYDTWNNALGGDPDSNILGTFFIMRESISNKYWLLYFNTWTIGSGGGGFSYARQEMKVVPISSITFPDGSKMSSAASSGGNNTWDIPTIAFVAPDGDDASGVVGDGNKPYATINKALDESNQVIILPGTYSENITRTITVDTRIYAVSGVILSKGFIISGTGQKFTLTGHADFVISTDNTIIQLAGTVLCSFEFNTINTTGLFFSIDDTCILEVYGKNVNSKGGTSSGIAIGNAKIYINLVEDLITSSCLLFTKPTRGANSYSGTFIINARNVIMNNANSLAAANGSIFNVYLPGTFYFDINADVYQLSNSTTSGILSTGNAVAIGSKIIFRKNLYMANGDVAIKSVNVDSYLEMNGSIYAPNGQAFSLGTLSTAYNVNCIINNSRIQSKYKNRVGAGTKLNVHNSTIKVTDPTSTGIFTAISSGFAIQTIGLYNTMLYLANASGEVMQNDVPSSAASIMNTVGCRSNVTSGPAIDNWEGIVDFPSFTLPDIQTPILP